MYDIITFGSAAQDIHIKSKLFKILQDQKQFVTGEGICLPFGSKIEIEDIIFASGGGGTNAAATFGKQGFKTAYCGAIGADISGLEIIRELKHFKVDIRLVVKKKEKHTNHSIVLSNTGLDRTIMVYRGASDMLTKNDIPWKKLKTKWIYLAPLGGLLCEEFEYIVDMASQKGIKIAANPSIQQLALPDEKLKKILGKIDVLFLNREEAAFLTKIPYEQENEIFQKLDELCPGVAVMTKGGDGVLVSDGKYYYFAKPHPDRKVVDTTGAGDSFASGFLSEYMRNKGDIEKSIQLGMANSEANLKFIGAKTGLLDKGAEFKPVEVKSQLCTENNLCIEK